MESISESQTSKIFIANQYRPEDDHANFLLDAPESDQTTPARRSGSAG